MNETRAREEICRVARSLFERGYAHATAGNISMRLDDGYLITPTDACLGFVDPARLARLSPEGRQTGGDLASKTIGLHLRIYEAARRFDPATSCVIHTHSTHCVALTLDRDGAGVASAPDGTSFAGRARELLPPITPYFVMKVGHVPVIAYRRPGAPDAARDVADAIARYGEAGTPIRAVMLARLGPNVWHESPAAAMAVLEEVEETARLVVARDGNVAPLTPAQIDELRLAFGARW